MRPEIKYTSESDIESVLSTEEPKTTTKKTETPQKYVCIYKDCGKAFTRIVSLDRHEFIHTGIKKHKCFHEDCTQAYTNTQSLKRHIKFVHERTNEFKNVKCDFDFCKKMFTTANNMRRHIREVHENPKVYKCSHCDEKFPQRLKLRRHEVKHTGVYPFSCTKCSKQFVQEYFLKRHVCTKTYHCDYCEESFEKWTQLLAHRKALNHKPVHKCDQCSKEFPSPSMLAEHMNSHADDKEVFKCTHEGCTRFYAYRRNLMQHIRTAHEGNKIPCTVENCEMTLSNKTSLKHHIKVIHKEPAAKKPKKKPAKRKDANKPRQSTLSKLSGVFIEKQIDQMIIDGTAEVEIDPAALEEEISQADRNVGEE